MRRIHSAAIIPIRVSENHLHRIKGELRGLIGLPLYIAEAPWLSNRPMTLTLLLKPLDLEIGAVSHQHYIHFTKFIRFHPSPKSNPVIYLVNIQTSSWSHKSHSWKDQTPALLIFHWVGIIGSVGVTCQPTSDSRVSAYNGDDLFALTLWKYVRMQMKMFILHCALMNPYCSVWSLKTSLMKRPLDLF